MRGVALLSLLALGAACAATAPAPPPRTPAETPAVAARVQSLGREIDELGRRYEGLLKQNAAIEKLLAQLGFTVRMAHDTVQQRVELMRRFERAEAARTAAYERLRALLRTVASQHKAQTDVAVRAGQIVVRIAESALFDARGRLRTEAAPLVWAVADGLQGLAGRRFEVVAEVPAPAAADDQGKPARRRRGPARARHRRTGARSQDAWQHATGRATAVLRLLVGAGIAADRLAAVERRAAAGTPPARRGAAAERFLEIIVLPTRDELPRVHGAVDTAPPAAAPAP